MSTSGLRSRIREEVDLVPEEKLASLYDLLHYFRLGLEKKGETAGEIMALAGSWEDMPDEVFADLTHEMTVRRQRLFGNRKRP